ncbi:MAG: SHOCT domain-containing protein [Cryobacterium sp.]|nr:SHOCT domain-containing protein [Cryobacterium sp.]
MMWGDSWGMGWWWLIGLLLLVGIVLLIVLLVRMLSGSQGGTPGTAGTTVGPSRARQILDERFATGELTADQYREQVQVLGKNP